MGSKYSTTQRESSLTKSKQPHEIWRGLGCLMILIIPVISIAAGYETISFALKSEWSIPYQLLGTLPMPDIAYKLSGLRIILEPVTKIPNFYANAIASILYMVTISGMISVIYAATYNMVGPSRYGPTDAPPPKVKITKKSR
jgi:hypothetical protein